MSKKWTLLFFAFLSAAAFFFLFKRLPGHQQNLMQRATQKNLFTAKELQQLQSTQLLSKFRTLQVLDSCLRLETKSIAQAAL